MEKNNRLPLESLRSSLFFRLSHVGTSRSLTYKENKTVILMNWINLLIFLVAILGFSSTLIDSLLPGHGKIGMGSLRLLLMGLTAGLSLLLSYKNRIFLARLLTTLAPGFFLLIFSTLFGDVRIEYFFYYPFAATALAILPVLLFHSRKERIIRLLLMLVYLVLTLLIDQFLFHFSPGFRDVFGNRYFFYKMAQLLLFFFVVPVVSILRNLNERYESQLLEQKEQLQFQSEELHAANEEMTATNEELSSLTEELGASNEKLKNYRDHLERMVEEEKARLKANQTRYQLLFENANDGIFIMQDDLFFDCNIKTLHIFGCTREQIINHKPSEFSPPFQTDGNSSYEKASSYIKAAYNNEPQRFEWTHQRPDKSLFDAEISLNLFEMEGGKYLQAIVRDITEKKRAEKALQESERKIRAIFDLSYQFIGLLTPDGILIESNRTALDFIGMSFHQLEGNPFWETPWWTHSDETKEAVKKAIERAGNGEQVQFETTHLSKSGDLRKILFSLKPVRDKHGKIIYLIPEGLDITEQKKAEAALKKSEERLQRLLGSVTDYIYSVQLENGKVKGTIHRDGCLAITGYLPEEFQKDPELWGKIVSEEDKARVMGHFEQLTQGFSVTWIEHRIIHKDGSVHWVRNTPVIQFDENGEVAGYDGLISDITARKLAEQALSDSEEQYRKLLEALPDMIMLSDAQSNILYANEQLKIITGITEADFRNPDRKAHVHEEDLPMIRKHLMELIRGEKTTTPILQNRFIDQWGNLHWFSGTITRLTLRGETVFQTVTRDITETKQAEEALRLSEERFSKTFHESPVPMMISSLESKILVDVNEAFVQLSGYAKQEVVGKSARQLNLWKSEEDQEKILDFIHSSSNSFREEISYLNKKNETVICNTALMKINISGEWCLIGIMEDITSRKLLQQQLLDTIIETEEKERRKFAADLHDEIGPQLATINIYASSLRKRISDPEHLGILNEMSEINKNAISAVRELSNNMSPHVLENYGLEAAIRAETEQKSGFFRTRYRNNAGHSRLDRNTSIIAYRIIKELLNNTMKHAAATDVEIETGITSNVFYIHYQDNGRGFDLESLMEKEHAGLGLLNIRSRIVSTGGSYEMKSETGKGFSLFAKIPLSR